MISTVQAQWNSATMRVQIEKACAAEAIWRLELGKVRRTAEPLPAKVRRGEIDFRLRAGGTIPSLKSRLSNIVRVVLLGERCSQSERRIGRSAVLLAG